MNTQQVTYGEPALPIGELFTRSFEVYKKSFARFWASLAVLLAPGLILFLIASLFDFPSTGTVLFAFLGIVWLVVAYLFFQGIVVKIVEDVEVEGRVVRPIGEMFSSAAPQIPNLIVLAFAYNAVYFAGLYFFIIPGIIVALKLFVMVPALFVDERPVFASMARSAELTRGNLWRLFGIYLLFVAAAFLLFLLFSAILSESIELGLILALVAAVLILPYLAMFTAIAYFELRFLKEGAAAGPAGTWEQPGPGLSGQPAEPELPSPEPPAQEPKKSSTRTRIDIDP